MPTPTDLVTDLPADFEVFGQAVDTSLADLKGGTTGQILSKATNTDMDFTWITNDVGDITGVTAGTGISGGGTSGTVTITNSMATEITAKGDLIVGTGSATFDNLAAGSNGETLVADSSTSTGLRYQGSMAGGKNSIVGGNFDIWQRGTSFASPATYSYTADRWQPIGGGGTATAAQETSVIQDGSTYSYRITTGAASSFMNIASPLESATVNALAGKTVTYSIYVRANATFTGVAVTQISTNTTADTSSGGAWTVLATNNSVTPSTSGWTRISLTATIPSGTKGLRVENNFGVVQASGAILYWSQAQLEIGSVATTFTRAGGTIQGELAACQRYYYRKNSELTGGAFGVGQCFSITQGTISIPHPVTMRTTPTLARSGLSLTGATGTRNAVSAISNNGSNVNTFAADFTASAIVAGNATTLVGSGTSTTDYIEASAEL